MLTNLLKTHKRERITTTTTTTNSYNVLSYQICRQVAELLDRSNFLHWLPLRPSKRANLIHVSGFIPLVLFRKVFIGNIYIKCPQCYPFAETARSIYHHILFANNPFSMSKKIEKYIVPKLLWNSPSFWIMALKKRTFHSCSSYYSHRF